MHFSFLIFFYFPSLFSYCPKKTTKPAFPILNLHREISVYNQQWLYLEQQSNSDIYIYYFFFLSLNFTSVSQALFNIYRNHLIIDKGSPAASSTIQQATKWTLTKNLALTLGEKCNLDTGFAPGCGDAINTPEVSLPCRELWDIPGGFGAGVCVAVPQAGLECQSSLGRAQRKRSSSASASLGLFGDALGRIKLGMFGGWYFPLPFIISGEWFSS